MIFKVNFSGSCVVGANSVEEALSNFKDLLKIDEGIGVDIEEVSQITHVKELTHGWDGTCIPFCTLNDQTIQEILDHRST